MGYSYDNRNRLCCDNCGRSGGVRKVRCPFYWCPAVALCRECRRTHREYASRTYHTNKGCLAHHLEYQRQNAEMAHLISEGRLVRVAACGDNGRVLVTFAGQNGTRPNFWMAKRTYHAIPLGVNATVEDYQKFGKVTRARRKTS